MSDILKTLDVYEQQEVSWLKTLNRRMKYIKEIAKNIESHLNNERMKLESPGEALVAISSFNRLLIMALDEDIESTTEQLNKGE